MKELEGGREEEGRRSLEEGKEGGAEFDGKFDSPFRFRLLSNL